MKGMLASSIVVLLLSIATALAASRSDDDYRGTLAKWPDREAGERTFAACAACHRPDGSGRAEGSVPRIGGERYAIIVRQLVDYRHGLRWDARMQANASAHRLTDLQAIADVAAWVSQLDPPPPVRREEGQYLALGRGVYSSTCARCHGAGGEGKADAPRLAAQHPGYLVQQMRDMVEGRRPNSAASHARLLEPLDFRAIEGIADAMMRQD